MQLSDFIARATDLINKADAVIGTARQSSFGDFFVDYTEFSSLRAAGLSFLKNVYGMDHPYYTDFNSRCKDGSRASAWAGRGILAAAKDEMAGGWITTTTGIVSAEIFADFLGMAAHLLDEHYKDASAVVTGSVLEEHLRKLCNKVGVPTETTRGTDLVPKKADTMNSDLTAAGAYGKLDQKAITSWLDLRNKAAHGRYGEYNEEQVRLMHSGITEFMARVAP